MAKAQYIGVGGVARKAKKQYIGVSGVARKITKGYIGVNGVARQYWSSESKYTVTITGQGHTGKAYVTINGTKYIGATTLKVNPGTTVTCTVMGATGWEAAIFLNGAVVKEGGTIMSISYDYVVNKNATIELEIATESSYTCGYIHITEN